MTKSEELVKRLRSQIGDDVREIYSHEALFRLAADRIAQLEAERDEALRRRDAWRARAENHVEIVNALRSKTAGQDSRTLSRALLGAAKMEAEARADALEAKLREAVEIAKSIVRDWESTEEDRWPGGAEEECSSYASRASRIARLTGEEQDGGDDE